MALLQPGTAPPAHYYADNLLRLLAAVARQYSDLLSAEESCLIERICGLPADAIRLYARLLTRKGPLFRLRRLSYAEVANGEGAVDALAAAGLIEHCPTGDAGAVLALFTAAELEVLFPGGGKRAQSKAERLAALLAHADPLRGLAQRDPWLCLRDPEAITRFLLLFFGDRHRNFSAFVLEDLGVRRYEPYPLAPEQRLFRDRAELELYLEYVGLEERVDRLQTSGDACELAALAAGLDEMHPNRLLERRRSRLLNRLGQLAERIQAHALALACYASSTLEPARERRARIELASGHPERAAAIVSEIRERPLSAGERAFAEQFGTRCIVAARADRSRSPRRAPLVRPRDEVAVRHLQLPHPPTAGVEQAALRALLSNGGIGRHLENRLSMGLLGLAIWDIVFAPVPGAFVNAYQEAPLDLFCADFRRVRSKVIDTRLRALTDRTTAHRTITSTFRAKHGIANALVHWPAFDESFLDRVLYTMPASHLLAVFDHALDDLGQYRSGFPDLILLHGPGQYLLVEVKGPGDQLRREQHLWFDCFRRAGIPAMVLRVRW
jgi:hypothetical protein